MILAALSRPWLRPTISVGGGGESLWFEHDYSEGAFPEAGWGSAETDNPAFTRTRLAGAGPNGEDAVRITYDAYSGVATSGGNNYGGDYHDSNRGTPITFPGAGESLFYRGRFRFSAGTDFHNWDQTDGTTGGIWRRKIGIWGDNSETNNSRVIPAFEGYPVEGGGPEWYLVIAKDGGDDVRTSAAQEIFGSWFNIQIEVRYSTSLDATDGYYKVWLNTNTYASPTIQALGIIVNIPSTANVSNGYVNNGVATGGEIILDHCGIQFGPTFDDAWHS